MLVGAYVGFIAAYYGARPGWASWPASSPAWRALFMVVFCVRLGLDQIVVGIAILLSGGDHQRPSQGQFGQTYPRLGVCRRSRSPS